MEESALHAMLMSYMMGFLVPFLGFWKSANNFFFFACIAFFFFLSVFIARMCYAITQ